MKRLKTCAHEGKLENPSISVADVHAAISEGREFFVHGACASCGNLVEREYGAIATLPTLQAELIKTASLAADTQVLPWPAGERYAPAAIYFVHRGEGLTGVC